MKYLSETNIENKRVLLRCDFNVSVVNNKIVDNSKIIKSLKTINYLLERNNKVIILSHFGRVKKAEDLNSNSLKIVYDELKKYIDVSFIPDPLKLEEIIKNDDNKCYLVENTRFTDYPEKRESANDLDLAKYWSQFADIFVLDAFASAHRVHSSTAGLAKYLPSYLGLTIEDEINNLSKLVNNIEHPFLIIMGGAKVDDKIVLIEELIKKCDKLILTGGILNTFLKVAGKNVGNSLVSNDTKVIESVKVVIKMYNNKILFTDDFIVKRDNKVENIKIDDIKQEDIIYDNIINIIDVLNDFKLVFLNGTSGKYEEDNYEKGTLMLLKDLSDSKASVYVGGGDTVSAVNKFGFNDSFKYLSTGGGATLEYVAYGKLKAIEYIDNNKKDI